MLCKFTRFGGNIRVFALPKKDHEIKFGMMVLECTKKKKNLLLLF
jgi:hypothetical protein